MTATADAPALRVAPQWSIDRMLEASTARLSYRINAEGTGIFQVKGIHAVVLDRPGRGFEIPAGRFTIVHVHEGKVQRLLATPHLEYLDALQTLDLLVQLHVTLSRRGWVQLRDRAGQATRVARLPAGRKDRVGLYRYGTWRADLCVERAVAGGSPHAESLGIAGDHHLVTVNVWTEPPEKAD